MSAASSRDIYSTIIAEIGQIEALGQWYVHPVTFYVPAGGESIPPEAIIRMTEWPMVVFGLSALVQGPSADLVTVRLSDSQTENPYMDGFYSISSVIGSSATSRFMRFVKPLLLTENRGLRIEVRNLAADDAIVEIALVGVRIYGNPIARQPGI